MKCPTCGSDNTPEAEVCFSCGQRLSAPPIVRGSVVAERYEVVDLLGKGGMGLVYKALDRVLGEQIALKLLRTDLARTDEVARRFRTEIRLARRVRHRNVCGIHEYGEDGPLRYISMEFVDGMDLRQRLKRDGAVPAGEAIEIAIQVARGLEAIHEAGVIHRDLKTSNIMRDARGVIRLMDFGIAKQAEGETNATATGVIVGTPEYMSPEQARGQKLDFRSDLYSLGVIVFELFTGEVPFKGDTPLATVLMHLQEPPPLTGEAAERMPPAVLEAVRRMLAKTPEGRPTDAGEVARMLERALQDGNLPGETSASDGGQDEPIPVTEAMPTPVPATLRREPGMTGLRFPRRGVPLLAAAAVALLATAGWLYWRGRASGALAPVPTAQATPAPRGVVATTEDITPDGAGALPAAPATSPPPATTTPRATQAAHPTEPPRRAPARPPSTRAAPPPTTLVPTTTLPPPTTTQPPVPADTQPPAAATIQPPAAATTTTAPPSTLPAVPHPVSVASPPTTEAAGLGILVIKVKPASEIEVDGESVGEMSAYTVPLSAGRHTITFVHEKYQPLQRVVHMTAGERKTLRVDLKDEAIRK